MKNLRISFSSYGSICISNNTVSCKDNKAEGQK